MVDGGFLYLQIMSADVPAFVAGKPISEQMAATALSSYISYSGPVTIDEAAGKVTFKPQAAWRPDYLGSTQERNFRFEGGKMFFGLAPRGGGGAADARAGDGAATLTCAGTRADMNDILIGKGEKPVHLLAKYGNRHGLIAGATGTGKTVSLLVLAEGFSRLGVPVFMADVKGDVAGLALPGAPSDKVRQRAAADRRRRLHERRRARSSSGISTAARVIQSEPPSAKWVRLCSGACSS